MLSECLGLARTRRLGSGGEATGGGGRGPLHSLQLDVNRMDFLSTVCSGTGNKRIPIFSVLSGHVRASASTASDGDLVDCPASNFSFYLFYQTYTLLCASPVFGKWIKPCELRRGGSICHGQSWVEHYTPSPFLPTSPLSKMPPKVEKRTHGLKNSRPTKFLRALWR